MAETPRVFVSYSHDSPDHKRWVGELCKRLIGVGIDIKLDQWDLSPGDDLTLFMEQGVTAADRVLVICTDDYVRKADGGLGGVGYERLVVTAELVQNLGTNKFIPVVRSGAGDRKTPIFLATRLFVDFRDDAAFEQNLEKLAREIHKAPDERKPPLGNNPYARTDVDESSLAVHPSRTVSSAESHVDLVQLYHRAMECARGDDLVGWRQLVKRFRTRVHPELHEWRATYEQRPAFDMETATEALDKAVEIVAPLFVMALAGVESEREQFRDQRGLFDDIYEIDNWNQSGRSVLVGLPSTLGFVYQALHGAASLATGQIGTAVAFAQMPLKDRSSGAHKPLWAHREIVGWPDGLGGNCVAGWIYLSGAGDRWAWISEVFGSERDYRVALSAYYMTLNVLELCSYLAAGRASVIEPDIGLGLDVPIGFGTEPAGTIQRAVKLLARHPDRLARIWKSMGVEQSQLEAVWPKWVGVCYRWLAQVHKHHLFSYTDRLHNDLFDLLSVADGRSL